MTQDVGKIPIKIVVTKDHTGKKNIEVMLLLDNLFDPSINSVKEIEDFKQGYLGLTDAAKDILTRARKARDGSAPLYWKLGQLLSQFINDKYSKFNITNYSKAFERDIGLPDTQIRELLEFVRLFQLDEVSPKAPVSPYIELVKKAGKLQAKGLLESSKNELMNSISNGNVPESKKYRAHLVKAILSGRVVGTITPDTLKQTKRQPSELKLTKFLERPQSAHRDEVEELTGEIRKLLASYSPKTAVRMGVITPKITKILDKYSK